MWYFSSQSMRTLRLGSLGHVPPICMTYTFRLYQSAKVKGDAGKGTGKKSVTRICDTPRQFPTILRHVRLFVHVTELVIKHHECVIKSHDYFRHFCGNLRHFCDSSAKGPIPGFLYPLGLTLSCAKALAIHRLEDPRSSENETRTVSVLGHN